ncbi:MAG TPA: metallophosphoesterase family protein [Sphingobium sp.]|uniref:metallophosphoesterase family protein n=1 Tax=Sphingobium sp. TaxID=1912891 RepID=UPI002ED11CB5
MTFFSRIKAGMTRERTPSTAAGERIYVIGDVHGRHDLLCQLFDVIDQHSAALPSTNSVHLILLGDLVDRGPDSALVIEHLHALHRKQNNITVLLGNHEEVMLAVLGGHSGALSAWLGLGGDKTLQSYGAAAPDDGEHADRIIARARDAIPPHHVEWMRQWPLSAQSGDYFFCHAGVRPGVSLKRQAASDLLWIRQEFLGSEKDHGSVVVHGHSICSEVEMRHNRIGIDTGAYCTDILTALYLEGEAQEILSTRA